jgi:hypothetical protein
VRRLRRLIATLEQSLDRPSAWRPVPPSSEGKDDSRVW